MTLDDVRKLQQRKYREQFGCFIAEGEHLVLELEKAAARNPALLQARLYVSGAYRDWKGPLPVQLLEERQMAKISDTKTPQGILAVVPLAALAERPAPRGERAFYLHEVQDPGNLGTILRSMAWFGGFRCLLSPGSVDPFSPKVVRASMGAIFHVPVETAVQPECLGERFGSVAVLDMQGKALPDPAFRHHECYVFGNEARGLPPGLLPQGAVPWTIPGRGDIDSLNLATTASICLYEICAGAQFLA